MAYKVYLGKMLVPVTPSKITYKYKGQNKTINLLDGSEINMRKPPGLTEIEFDAIIPQNEYKFAVYKSGEYKKADYFLEYLEGMKIKKKKFQFTIWREAPGIKRTKYKLYKKNHTLEDGTKVKAGDIKSESKNGKKVLNNGTTLFDQSITVCLEDYTIKEDAENGIDLVVTIRLKQFVAYGTKKVKISKTGTTSSSSRDNSDKTIPKTHKVKKGDTLQSIAKKYLGKASDWKKLYNINKTAIVKAAKKKKKPTNGTYIEVGLKLKIPQK